jgi:hypothetical protein
MKPTRLSRTKLVLAGLLALAGATALTTPAHADERRSHGREYHDHEFREHEFRNQRFLDSRYHHDHYYPPVGHEFRALPAAPFVAMYGGRRFYFSTGIWYRPYGSGFVVAAPPFGVVIPVLPPYYTQVWVGGSPYYYSNNVYYAQRPEGYVVVEPPRGTVVVAPPPPANGVTELGPAGVAPPTAVAPVTGATVAQGNAGSIFVYPRQGQSIEQQRKDRADCDAWAASQASPANAPDYQRALSACMDGRGYTVK